VNANFQFDFVRDFPIDTVRDFQEKLRGHIRAELQIHMHGPSWLGKPPGGHREKRSKTTEKTQ